MIAWPIDHTRPDGKLGLKNVEFKIKAQLVDETAHARRARLHYEHMLKHVSRQQRKWDKEERARVGREMHRGHTVDEL